MHKTPFDSAYTAMTADGSEWAVEHLPNLILLAIDYASIAGVCSWCLPWHSGACSAHRGCCAVYPDQPGVHVPLLSKDIVIVEGLVLDEVPTGALHLICLPPRLEVRLAAGTMLSCAASCGFLTSAALCPCRAWMEGR